MTELDAGVELLARTPDVVFCPHPLLPAQGRRLIFEAPRVGERLDAYLVRVIGRLPEPCVVTIGDRVVSRDWWGRVTVKPGTVVQVAAAVAGGDGSDVGRIVLTIAVVVAAVYTGGLAAGALGWSGTGAMTLAQTAAYVAASSAVMAVGMMAVNALMPLPTNDLSRASGEAASPTYSLSGASNRARRYEPLPLVIGTHRMFPDAACASYTLFEGDDQYLYAAYNFGFGDLVITDLRIGDTPLTDYQDVTTALSVGAMPALVHGNVDTLDGGPLTHAGGPIQRTLSLASTRLEIDLQYVLFGASGSGLVELAVPLLVEYRPVGGSAWLAFVDAGATVTIAGATRTPVRRTLSRNVPSGQYEVRVTKNVEDTTDARVTCDISVSALRSFQPAQGNFDGQHLLGLKIRASGQLNGVVSQLSALVSHRLDGVATSNPAKWFKAFALGAFGAAGRRLWGAGISASRLDVAALDAWATWCDAQGLSCNMVIDQAMSVATVLDRIARCGRGSKTWATGTLGAIWDAGGLPVTAMFSPVNIRRGSFSIAYPSEPLADELEVSYINPDNGWQRDSVRVPSGATDVRRTASVELIGCTSTALAGREANLLYAQNLYRYRTISWEADAEGLTIRKGDVVALSHDLTQWGQGGRLVAVPSTTSLQLDRLITLKPAGCWMAVCRPSGQISYHRVQVGATEAESDIVTLLDPLPTTPAADGSRAIDWRYLADAKATPGWRVKVTEVVPLQGLEGVRIIAQDDPAEYYAAESGTFTHVATAATSAALVISGLQVAEELIQAGAGYAVQLHLTWSAKGDVATTRVRFKIDAGGWQEGGFATGARHTILIPETGTVTLEVTAFNGLGQSSPASRLSATHVIVGQDVPPPAPTGFSVTTTADGTRVFAWSVAAVPPDVTYLEIRYASSSATAWAAMTPAGRVPYGSGRAESNAPAAGTWTFEARMLDASGNYSASGPRVTVTLTASSSGGVAGANLAYNTAAHPTLPNDDGWSLWTNAGSGFAGSEVDKGYVLPAFNSYAMPSSSSRFLHAVGAAVAGREAEWNVHPQLIQVAGGQRVQAHALTGAHRCTAAVCINWYDGSGGLTQVTVGTNVSEKPGGITMDSWKLAGGFSVAPAGTRWMSLCLKLREATGADAYAFFDKAFIAFALDSQTILSPWAEGAKTLTNTNQMTDGAGLGLTAVWSSVSGAGKPIDSAGKVLDGGSGSGAGQRNANDPTTYYPVGTTQQFKWSGAVGLSFGEWGVLRTERQYGDDTGGPMTQTWKSAAGEWKRIGWIGSGWAAWTRKVDRQIDASNVVDFMADKAVGTDQLADGASTVVMQQSNRSTYVGIVADSWTAIGTFDLLEEFESGAVITFIATGIIWPQGGPATVSARVTGLPGTPSGTGLDLPWGTETTLVADWIVTKIPDGAEGDYTISAEVALPPGHNLRVYLMISAGVFMYVKRNVRLEVIKK